MGPLLAVPGRVAAAAVVFLAAAA